MLLRRLWAFAWVAVVITMISTAQADTLTDERAKSLGNEIRCVVCQSQSITDSESDMARDLRQLVHDKIDAGWSDDKILDYVRQRYGDFILMRPPYQYNTWLLWAAPWVFVVGGGFIGFRLSRRKQSKTERNR